MRTLLLFLAGISLIAGAMVFVGAGGENRELEALGFLLMSSILFSAAAIVGVLETARKKP